MANPDQQHHDLTKNFLGKELYVIVTTPVAPREELDKHPAASTWRIRSSLKSTASCSAPGRWPAEDGARVGGMIIIRAKLVRGGARDRRRDPYHKDGLRTYTLTRWTVNEGSYGIRVNYSDQTVTIE